MFLRHLAFIVLCGSLSLGSLAKQDSISASKEANGWFTATPMIYSRRAHSMVEILVPNDLDFGREVDKIMVIGGYDADPVPFPFDPAIAGNPLASCEIYDPQTNAWT